MLARRLARILLLSLLTFAGCHPGACWFPPELPRGEPSFTLTSSDATYPSAEVDVIVDDEGVPHIFGQSDTDLAYAQGFMHAKERQFQMVSFKLALFGRLAELQGEGEVSSDQAARLITFGVDEQVANLSAREHDLLEAYAAGANHGAEFAGPTLEMAFTGGTWEAWQPRDCVAIIRFFAWDLSTIGMYAELARTRIMNRLEEDDPVRAELLASVWTGGTPVVRGDEHSGALGFDYPWAGQALGPALRPLTQSLAQMSTPAHLQRRVAKDHPAAAAEPKPARPNWLNRMRGAFVVKAEGGASNVWAVRGSLTTSGNATLSHDPHLSHRFPSLFYLTHLESDDFLAAGASVPGAPGVLLGHGRRVAWGTPVSNADTVDMVRIQPVPGREDEAYFLDGEEVEFEKLIQVYKTGFEDDADTVTETWLITEFGPVLPPAWQYLHDEGEMYAMMWPGHRPLEGSGEIVTSLWDLARANNVDEAEAAIQKLSSPAITVGMAFDDGTIAYRLSGDIPIRKSAAPPWLPRDGTTSDSKWAGRLPPEFKPQLTNPARGYLVAANQRIVGEGGPAWEVIGIEGSNPFRALRITEILNANILLGSMTKEAIFNIQQDIRSVYARNVAPIYAAHCPESVEGFERGQVATFCEAVAEFTGLYDVDSTSALAFQRLDQAFRIEVLKEHLGEELAFQLRYTSFIETTLYRRILASAEGEEAAIFDLDDTVAHDGIAAFVTRATKAALDLMADDDLGFDRAQWRWGLHHYRAPSSPLKAIPLVGGNFERDPAEEPGCRLCPRAENGQLAIRNPDDIGDAREGRTPTHKIRSGAVLRIHADMSTPPLVKIVNDLGQSGHFGHPMYDVAYDRWSENDPRQLATSREDAESIEQGRVTLAPKPN